jgi:hypothetical protein
MFTGSFQKLRKRLGEIAAIDAIAHFGPGLFDIGNPGTLQTAAVVLRKEAIALRRSEHELVAVRLVDADGKDASLKRAVESPIDSVAAERQEVFRLSQDDLLSSPRQAWCYWLSPRLREVFSTCKKLRDVSPPRQGLATTDNARFVRYWWEVEPTRGDAPCRASAHTWFPYAKSGRFRRWHESPRHRVNWASDGAQIKQNIAQRYPYLNGRWEWVAKNSQFYGRAGVTYSYLTAGDFSARLMPAGAIFDVAGSALFPDDPLTILAILNSATARHLLHAVNPTVNFQVGDLAELPLPCAHDDELAALARRAVELRKRLDGFDETSPDFIAPPAWRNGADELGNLTQQLHETERQIDQVTARLYDVSMEAGAAPFDASTPSQVQFARQWISFAVGRLLGRWNQPRRIDILWLRPTRPDQLKLIETELAQLAGERDARDVAHCAGGIEAYLARDFYAAHVKQHHRRPIYLALGDRDGASLVLHDFATSDAVDRMLHHTGASVGDWTRCVDDGISINLAPLVQFIDDRSLAKFLSEVRADLNAGRYAWSGTASQCCASY